MQEGLRYLPECLSRADQESLVAELREIIAVAPLYRPTMPRNGKPFSVMMTNAGSHGWLSDRRGYRYVDRHPETGQAWPQIPKSLLDLWRRESGYVKLPQCCLVNYYTADARMGLHQDRDEEDLLAPVLSLSLGDSALFRVGGLERRSPTRSFRVHSGDLVILDGAARLCFHGIDRLLAGSSRLLSEGGRINVTLRRVTH